MNETARTQGVRLALYFETPIATAPLTLVTCGDIELVRHVAVVLAAKAQRESDGREINRLFGLFRLLVPDFEEAFRRRGPAFEIRRPPEKQNRV